MLNIYTLLAFTCNEVFSNIYTFSVFRYDEHKKNFYVHSPIKYKCDVWTGGSSECRPMVY